MTTWSGGWGWEPSGDEITSTWGDVDAGVGWPDVIVAGVQVTDRCTGASWATGREWWLADAEPGSATVTLQGILEGTAIAGLTVGDTLEIRAQPAGVMWKGWIDNVTESTVPQDGELAYGLTIAASDAMSRLLAAELYSSLALPAGTLVARLSALATAAGVPGPLPVVTNPTNMTLVQLAAVTLAGSTATPLTLGDHLSACERASNAIVAVARDGSWIVQPRARVVVTPEVLTLDDDSDPNRLERVVATPERVRNVFTVAGVETVIADSVTEYGRRAYDVPGAVSTTPPPYALETMQALATPEPFAAVTIPVRTRTAAVVGIQPFAWCRVSTRPADEYYQALSTAWTAAPDEWTVAIGLDRTQMTIAGPGDPDFPDPPDPDLPNVATKTVTFRLTKSAFVVKTTGGLEAGNGQSVDLLVGLLADGNLARGLMRFDVVWSGKVTKVNSAQLRLKGAAQYCMSYGNSPSYRIRRITESWSRGSYYTRCAFSGGNAVVWPGPPTTSNGERPSANAPQSPGAWAEVNLLDIVRAWASGSPNYGIQIAGASESSTNDRAPLWGHNTEPSDQPELVVNYTYEV